MSEITWRQRKIQVTNEKVRLFFLNLQEFEDEIKVRRAIIRVKKTNHIYVPLEIQRFIRYENEFLRKLSQRGR
jgi:hypothetical protein